VTFRRILVATDFAESAERALECAQELARRHGAELILLHVYMPPPAYPEVASAHVAAIYAEQQRWIEDALEQRAQRARAAGLLVRPLVRTGSPASTIAETAEAEGADMAVVGTHGRAGIDRLLLGSVAERVVRLASCPVLVVKTPKAATRTEAA
jgi:nucleotide-binding universal stress UspA family protein